MLTCSKYVYCNFQERPLLQFIEQRAENGDLEIGDYPVDKVVYREETLFSDCNILIYRKGKNTSPVIIFVKLWGFKEYQRIFRAINT